MGPYNGIRGRSLSARSFEQSIDGTLRLDVVALAVGFQRGNEPNQCHFAMLREPQVLSFPLIFSFGFN